VTDAGPALHVVLVEPLIPQNTGAVGRLCVGTGLRLHLIEPLGFDLDDKAVRRAGLDYWREVDLHVHPSWSTCVAAIGASAERFTFLSSRVSRIYTEQCFERGDVLVFGRETSGLGAALLAEAGERAYTIPLTGPIRSLNLSMAVGITVFEALRQMEC
jgi:tRNA (cytidine/uridine-2'-O-)-methyltransferase